MTWAESGPQPVEQKVIQAARGPKCISAAERHSLFFLQHCVPSESSGTLGRAPS